MKKTILIIGVVLVSIMSSCSDNNQKGLDTNTVVALTLAEKDDLLRLREEEKLARDVYLYSYDMYGISLFSNIAASEQKHMDKALALLNTYSIPDPAVGARGVFVDPVLQDLYDALTSKVDISLLDALEVGATIEDLDIKDIDDFEDRTDKIDILNTYDKLKCASRNHMRSFYSELVNNSVTYDPQFISLAELSEIISSSNEKCGN